MNLWRWWENLVLNGRPFKLFVIGSLMVALLAGSQTVDYAVPWMQDIFHNPYQGDQAGNQYLLTSFLFPFVGYLLGLKTADAFVALNAVLLLLGSFYLIRELSKTDKARYFVYSFLLFSLSSVIVPSLGSGSDVAIFLFSSLLVIHRQKSLFVLLWGFCLGLSHLEQFYVIALFVLLMLANDFWTKRDKAIFWSVLALVGSVSLAKAFFVWFFSVNGFELDHSRTAALLDTAFRAIAYWGENPLLFLFSAMDFYWVVFPLILIALKGNSYAKLIVVIGFFLSLALGGSVWDPTRVFALLFWSWVVYVISILSVEQLDVVFKKSVLPGLLLVAILFPAISLKDGGSMVFVGSKTYKSYQICH